MWGDSEATDPGSFQGQKLSFELKNGHFYGHEVIFWVMGSFYMSKKRYLKTDFISRCFIYI